MEKNVNIKPLLVIIGQTASGKSALAVNLACAFNGEVVSADSRQVYKGLDIGSGKITKQEMRGVPHHLLDVASSTRTFTVAQYQSRAQRVIKNIWQRNKLPILCGGTGLYIKAITEGIIYPQVPPNQKLRRDLEKISTTQLFILLKRRDPARAKTIERHNRRRLIRALEIIESRGKVPLITKTPITDHILNIGIKKSPATLKKSIAARLQKRLRGGLIAEVKKLHTSGLSWKRLENFGLEYRYVSQYLQGKINKPEMVGLINHQSWQYARRQMTWFKRTPNVNWIKNYKQAYSLIKKFFN